MPYTPDMLGSGLICAVCGEFHEDGKQPMHPRTCLSCRRRRPDLTVTCSGREKEAYHTAHKIAADLEYPDFRVLNDGYHIQFCQRWNFYLPKGKWYDATTGEKGQGVLKFVNHVRPKLKKLLIAA